MFISRPAGIFRAKPFLLTLSLILCLCPSAQALDAGMVISRLEAAFAKVDDYQTEVEVKSFGSDGSTAIERFLYTFKKPKWIRLDMKTPHAGMVLIYPDREGKVLVRLSRTSRLPPLHLSLDSHFLRNSAGQRLDQTDMGQLIGKIRSSLTDQRKGPAEITEGRERLLIRVLAEDHFRPGITTLYGFHVDERLWLPARVDEATPTGSPERSVAFWHLRINTGITDAFFRMEGQ
jgi:outer membrane lipoprotein-sorting protein